MGPCDGLWSCKGRALLQPQHEACAERTEVGCSSDLSLARLKAVTRDWACSCTCSHGLSCLLSKLYAGRRSSHSLVDWNVGCHKAWRHAGRSLGHAARSPG